MLVFIPRIKVTEDVPSYLLAAKAGILPLKLAGYRNMGPLRARVLAGAVQTAKRISTANLDQGAVISTSIIAPGRESVHLRFRSRSCRFQDAFSRRRLYYLTYLSTVGRLQFVASKVIWF